MLEIVPTRRNVVNYSNAETMRRGTQQKQGNMKASTAGAAEYLTEHAKEL
jgi:hypothetical protein